eukprot:gb/GEZN01013735.1/.p1 GENE.gb/GEZN01013735.1/~~gb/GEZN01013735.1/.p1  ORF type:complete len:268 (-),score=36.29 gb/GEZN01013735.1/:115-918(-)
MKVCNMPGVLNYLERPGTCIDCKGEIGKDELFWTKTDGIFSMRFHFACFVPTGGPGKKWPTYKMDEEFLASVSKLKHKDQLRALKLFEGQEPRNKERNAGKEIKTPQPKRTRTKTRKQRQRKYHSTTKLDYKQESVRAARKPGWMYVEVESDEDTEGKGEVFLGRRKRKLPDRYKEEDSEDHQHETLGKETCSRSSQRKNVGRVRTQSRTEDHSESEAESDCNKDEPTKRGPGWVLLEVESDEEIEGKGMKVTGLRKRKQTYWYEPD